MSDVLGDRSTMPKKERFKLRIYFNFTFTVVIHFDDSIPISDSFNSAQIYPMEFFFVVTEKKGIVELTSKGTKMKQML